MSSQNTLQKPYPKEKNPFEDTIKSKSKIKRTFSNIKESLRRSFRRKPEEQSQTAHQPQQSNGTERTLPRTSHKESAHQEEFILRSRIADRCRTGASSVSCAPTATPIPPPRTSSLVRKRNRLNSLNSNNSTNPFDDDVTPLFPDEHLLASRHTLNIPPSMERYGSANTLRTSCESIYTVSGGGMRRRKRAAPQPPQPDPDPEPQLHDSSHLTEELQRLAQDISQLVQRTDQVDIATRVLPIQHEDTATADEQGVHSQYEDTTRHTPIENIISNEQMYVDDIATSHTENSNSIRDTDHHIPPEGQVCAIEDKVVAENDEGRPDNTTFIVNTSSNDGNSSQTPHNTTFNNRTEDVSTCDIDSIEERDRDTTEIDVSEERDKDTTEIDVSIEVARHDNVNDVDEKQVSFDENVSVLESSTSLLYTSPIYIGNSDSDVIADVEYTSAETIVLRNVRDINHNSIEGARVNLTSFSQPNEEDVRREEEVSTHTESEGNQLDINFNVSAKSVLMETLKDDAKHMRYIDDDRDDLLDSTTKLASFQRKSGEKFSLSSGN